ncbi:MAG TPA: ABC transporter permease [Candidatus Poseidoniaceae archaeon]|nr:MAG TPA: ABC transporter permease [Candidatus Poseidoniales archaeon]HIH53573.1 ABC transporter permease [Candidatus Poseidoniaceae archaeon]
MRLPFRLASRYIVKRRSGTLVHVISGISVTVIAAVATAMVCILSAFNGIEDLVKDLFGTLDADLAVVPQSGAVIPQTWGNHLADIPGVATWAPVLEDEVVVRADEAARVATVLGVDARYRVVSQIDRAIVEGAYAVEDSSKTCGCLGLGIRSELALKSDSLDPPLFSVSAPIRGRKLSRHRERAFRTEAVHACGTFSINADLDTRYLLLPLRDAQDLLDREGRVSRIEIKALPGWTQTEVAEEVERALTERLGEEATGMTTLTRDDKHKFITQTNRAEKWATFAILSFILIVAAFNIMASLTMLLLDKKKDLETLDALGMPVHMMEQAFGLQGLTINVIGGLVGVGLGSLLVSGQAAFGWLQLQGSVVPAYPVRLDVLDVLGTLAVVVFVGGLGSSAMVRHLIRRQTSRVR